MPRIARKDLETPFLHVMVQGVNKEYIFNKKEYIEHYLKLIFTKIEDCEFQLLAYCIMNNHAHFLVYTEDIKEFGKFMHNVNLSFAQMYNRIENRCGVLFRNRYKTEPIYDVSYLMNCIKYIHNNPVKANMVKNCGDYKYSSYNDYMKKIGVSQNEIIKSLFGEKCDFRELFDKTFEIRYMDVEDDDVDMVDEYIVEGVAEFKNIEGINIEEIFSNRAILKELVCFLNMKCGIKYVEIEKYFEIKKGVMNNLKAR